MSASLRKRRNCCVQRNVAKCRNGIFQQLGHSHDYVCLNFGSNLAVAMSVRNRGCGVVGCGFQFSRVSGLDFVAKKSSLTISTGRKARRGCAALFGSRLDHHTRCSGRGLGTCPEGLAIRQQVLHSWRHDCSLGAGRVIVHGIARLHDDLHPVLLGGAFGSMLD